ncbi:UNVERIFIED_CONTAM: hypothetical protein HDU68_003692 [Siphonaria sp. JEL0065]|nr:hypothetical protein HDU68_003692 [Siphonaria sp. JEL0065]
MSSAATAAPVPEPAISRERTRSGNPDIPILSLSSILHKRDDLIVESLLRLSNSPIDTGTDNDEAIAAALLGQLGYSDDQDSADDEDEGDFIIYDSDASTLAEMEAVAARAFLDFAQSARDNQQQVKEEHRDNIDIESNDHHQEEHDSLLSLAASAIGLSKLDRRKSSSAFTSAIRTPRFLQSPERPLDEIASPNDDIQLPDITEETEGSQVDWSKVFQEVEESAAAAAAVASQHPIDQLESNEKLSDTELSIGYSPRNTPATIPKKPKSRKESSSSSSSKNPLGIKRSSSSRYDIRLIRPYICVIGSCRKSYTKRRGLLSHGKSMHPESIELLKKVEPRLGGMEPMEDVAMSSDGDDFDVDSEMGDSDFTSEAAGSRAHKKRKRGGVEHNSFDALSPKIIVSDADAGKSVPPEGKTKKRGKRLSASDFTSDSGGEGMLTAEAAEELSLRIAFLNEQKPFVCTQLGCYKRYRNANGLKYHLDKGHLLAPSEASSNAASGNSSIASLVQNTAGMHVTQNSSAQSLCERIQETHIAIPTSVFSHTETIESEESSSNRSGETAIVDAVDAISGGEGDAKPFVCPHLGCRKAYKNKNGLLGLITWTSLPFHHSEPIVAPAVQTFTSECSCTCPGSATPFSYTPPPTPTPSIPSEPQKSAPFTKIYQAFVKKNGGHGGGNRPKEPMTSVEYWTTMAIIFFLVLLGGMFAGLTIGLMSIDETNLRILKRSGTPTEKMYAERIEPIRKNGHLLLVTLLLSNTIVNETLPILFGLVDLEGYQAVLFSTLLVLVFGELSLSVWLFLIIPQSICARYGLRVGAIFAWPVRVLIWLLFVVAYPIAKLLDYILGHKDGVIYRRAELKELIAMHDEDHHGPLNHEEVSILRAVLELRGKTAENVMTKLDDVLMLSLDTKLDESTMNLLLDAGHSRVPVYNNIREDIIGVVLVKQLILLDPEDAVPVYKSRIGRLPRVKRDTPLFEILHVFEEGRSHMAIVVDELPLEEESFPNTIITASPLWIPSPKTGQRRFATLGIITLEDVIEELIGQEIVDETDVYVDVNTKVKVGRVLDLILSRDNSSVLNSPTLEAVDDEQTYQNENAPLLAGNGVNGLGLRSPLSGPTGGAGFNIRSPLSRPTSSYGATSSSALKPAQSSGATATLRSPRMKGGSSRKFRETLVPAHELLQEFSARAAPPVFGFEDGQRVLISESGSVEVDVPHLALDKPHVRSVSPSASSGSQGSTHQLETLD